MTTAEEFLAHHGVKGMRWGVRKDRGSGGHTGGSGGTSKPKAHELSDEDLKKAIDRMNLEQQYTKLLAPKKPSANTEAKAFIKDLGKGLAKNAVNAAGTAAINAVMKK